MKIGNVFDFQDFCKFWGYIPSQTKSIHQGHMITQDTHKVNGMWININNVYFIILSQE
jgi:hypothetical protein